MIARDQFHRPLVATDICVFNVKDGRLRILLITRGHEPFKGHWALPGGLLRPNETLEQCAERELSEETNVRNIKLQMFGTYSAVDRDERERVISIAYYVLLPDPDEADSLRDGIRAGTDAASVDWFSTKRLPDLAFDHRAITKDAIDALKNRFALEKTGALKVASRGFTAQQLHEAYNCLSPKPINDYSNFWKLIRNRVVEDAPSSEPNSAMSPGRPRRYLRSRDDP